MYCNSNCVGSSLSRCTFNGPQCCNKYLSNVIATTVGPVVKNDAFNTDATFNGVQTAVNQLYNETEGKCMLCYKQERNPCV